MIPTLTVGDHLLVNKFIYGPRIPFTDTRFFSWKEPKRGDIVVFKYPENEDKNFIKRIGVFRATRSRSSTESS